MKKLLFLLGPELLWVIFFFLALWLAGRNMPPTQAGNAFLERLCWLGAFCAVALTFSVFLLPHSLGINRSWLLARVVVAVVIGVNVCLFKLIEGINYNDSRNSGVLGFWFYGILAGGAALIPGIILFFVRSGRAPGSGD